jgi:hypothetical protein
MNNFSSNVQWRVKLIFFLSFAPLPEFLLVECCFPMCLCVKTRTSDIHLGQKQRKIWSKNSAKNLLETIS